MTPADSRAWFLLTPLCYLPTGGRGEWAGGEGRLRNLPGLPPHQILRAGSRLPYVASGVGALWPAQGQSPSGTVDTVPSARPLLGPMKNF